MSQNKTTAISKSRTWPGFKNIKNLIIFGDSFSSVGYDSSQPIPTPESPLGVPYPGETFTEGFDSPNWVGWITHKYRDIEDCLLAFDFAVGGHEISDVRTQIHDGFIPSIGAKPDWALWDEDNTLFVVWVGINDVAYVVEEERTTELVEELFELVVHLYDTGARNFLFVDLPPIDRSPSASQRSVDAERIYTTWNSILYAKVKEFAYFHPETTTLVYSAWDTFTRVLDNPRNYGFEDEDVDQAGGQIWCDELHPTSRMHDVVARDISTFLNSVAPVS